MRPELSSFRAMGVTVEVGGADRDALRRIRALFAEREARFSRFRADSELSRLNSAPAAVAVVSAEFARAVAAALAAARATGGLVDPTLGAALETAGYDRDYDLLPPDAGPPGPPVRSTLRSLRLDGRVLTRAPGTLLDLNGVVKSMAVDDALALLPGPGFVSAGGDLAARGEVTVSLASGETVALRGGGIATSGSSRRRWLRGGRPQHHLIDGRTGRPAESCWTDATVAAGSCLAADVAARAAFLLGAGAPRWLDERGLAGTFLAPYGVTAESATWRALAEPLRAAA
jgi:thiamine biosynthesis lipoprotein